jgi:hypothetical protein
MKRKDHKKEFKTGSETTMQKSKRKTDNEIKESINERKMGKKEERQTMKLKKV